MYVLLATWGAYSIRIQISGNTLIFISGLEGCNRVDTSGFFRSYSYMMGEFSNMGLPLRVQDLFTLR